MKELANKIAFVTGASRGIGRVISLRLAEVGAQLILAGRDTSGLEETARLISESKTAVPPFICKMDLLDPDTIEVSVNQTLDLFGRIDVLVNNSGIAGKSVQAWELREEDWDEAIDTNLKGPFLMTKAVIPSMLECKSGSIIFIGSVTGKRPLIHRSVYAASKLGLVGLMRTLALELGPHNVRVNLISPGFVKGPRIERVIGELAKAENVTLQEMDAQMHKMVPLGDFVSPENIAEGVLFLASDRSAGITGDDLNISGGLVMY